MAEILDAAEPRETVVVDGRTMDSSDSRAERLTDEELLQEFGVLKHAEAHYAP